MDLAIRPAEARDAPALAQLLGELGYPAEAGRVAARLERMGADGVSALLVAELAGEVVGVSSYRIFQPLEYDAPACQLGALVVAESARGRRIGERLVRAVEQEARASGCTLVFVTSAKRRERAHAFYGRLGFEETGPRFSLTL